MLSSTQPPFGHSFRALRAKHVESAEDRRRHTLRMLLDAARTAWVSSGPDQGVDVVAEEDDRRGQAEDGSHLVLPGHLHHRERHCRCAAPRLGAECALGGVGRSLGWTHGRRSPVRCGRPDDVARLRGSLPIDRLAPRFAELSERLLDLLVGRRSAKASLELLRDACSLAFLFASHPRSFRIPGLRSIILNQRNDARAVRRFADGSR